MRILNDKEIIKAITDKPNIPAGQAMIDAQYRADIKGFMEFIESISYINYGQGKPFEAERCFEEFRWKNFKQLVEEK